jgi:16S rRNA (guanine966-N2)-methyltransferase
MRIIAGEARGMPLIAPPTGVRPTMDRVRAAIFSSLGDAVPGAKVLDLFSGSGAMGIEALSRGAASAVFVDLNPRSVQCVRDNLRKAKFEASVQTMDAMKFMELYASDGFDLIFADPPYAKYESDRDFATELLHMPQTATALNPGGTLIMERASRRDEPEGTVLSLLRARRYGKSEIAYYIAS